MSRGGQAFFIHNRVENIQEVSGMLQRLLPDARIAIGHGQMKGHDLEGILLDFMAGEYDILVSTTIVESGLDVPNANTMIIHQAHMFGLSDLHQMRGRVGRSNRKAFCYLIAHLAGLPEESRKRLQALEQFFGPRKRLQNCTPRLGNPRCRRPLGRRTVGLHQRLGL